MYVPSRFAMHHHADILQFVRQYGFATLISADFQATHLPLYLDENEGEFGTLYGHLARANPQAANLHQSTVLAIFTGPQAYISPRWYGKTPTRTAICWRSIWRHAKSAPANNHR